VAEDRTLAGASDEAVSIDDAALVGLPHPIDLPAAALATWGSLFADYELLQPFPQIGREVFTPTEEERAATDLDRFAGAKVETGKLFALEHRGFRRSSVEGTIIAYRRDLPNGHVAWLAVSPGVNLLAPHETPVQTLAPVELRRPDLQHPDPLPLGDLSPIVFSELVRDVASLAG
jgi:hypothetical protein